MSEEDASDSEIVVMDSKPVCPKSTLEQQLTDRHLRSQMGMIDTQLKALGLYEEGLSYEQKEELLAVVAASRETAKQEASMRQRAQEWQQEVIVDDAELGAKTAKLSLTCSSPSLVDACTSTVKAESFVRQSSAENPSSQELFETIESEIVPMNRTLRSNSPEVMEIPITFESNGSRCQENKPKRPVGRRGRGRRPITEHRTTKPPVSVSHAIEAMDTNTDDIIQVDSRHQKKELERAIPEWQPCGSPVADTMSSDRFPSQNEATSICNSSSKYAQKLLHSFDEFHTAVDKLQRNCRTYAAWGQPITVGRAYSTRSARSRNHDPESTDGLTSYQSFGCNSNTKESMCASYLRIQQFCKPVAPKSQPTSKGYKTASQSPKWPSLFSGNSALKRNTRLNRAQTMQSTSMANSQLYNRSPSTLSKRVEAVLHSKSGNFQENQHVAFPHTAGENPSPNDTSVTDPENLHPKSQTRTSTSKNIQPKLVLSQPNNRVYKLTQNYNPVQFNEKRRPFLRAIEDKPMLSQGNYADPAKRKYISSNVRAFTSPAKRLKGTGTA